MMIAQVNLHGPTNAEIILSIAAFLFTLLTGISAFLIKRWVEEHAKQFDTQTQWIENIKKSFEKLQEKLEKVFIDSALNIKALAEMKSDLHNYKVNAESDIEDLKEDLEKLKVRVIEVEKKMEFQRHVHNRLHKDEQI